jgi:hypothetical protein
MVGVVILTRPFDYNYDKIRKLGQELAPKASHQKKN